MICKDSPKSAATLARRALQGVMRDYYRVKPGRLVDEIDAAAKHMDSSLADALHALRKVGNVGAHMEADVNQIVAVDPGEAEALLQLIELMLDETYVARHAREERVEAVRKIAQEKEALRAAGAPAAKPGGKP